MDHITFDKLLLKTAFCCMACDGSIDKVEIEAIRTMCSKSPLFQDFDFGTEINSMLQELNVKGKEYLANYFALLKNSTLSEQEELELIEFAIGTLRANEAVEYSEIKFFKVIRSHLKVSNDRILESFPDIEPYLEEDIITDNFLARVASNYLDNVEIPKFEKIQLPDEDAS